jgi:acyl-CoA synthetase (AMP-forming)/AMP-acid ligase II
VTGSGNLGKMLDPSVPRDRIGFVFDQDPEAITSTFGQIDEEADAVARALSRLALPTGSTIAILADNHPAYVPAFLGIMRAGLVACPINWRLGAETVRFILADAGVRLILADPQRARLDQGGIPVVSIDHGYREWLDPGPFTAVEPERERVACLLYTSGSTGGPKGVPISHAGYWAGLGAFEYDRARITGTTALVAAPLYHLNAQSYCFAALYFGSGVVLQPRFDPARFGVAIERYRVDEVSGVPAMVAMAIDQVEKEPPASRPDWSQVTSVSLGSAPVSDRLLERIRVWFPNASVSNSYGTTETGIASFGPHPRGIPTPPESVGYPLSGIDARLIGGATDDEGELELRTPMMATGYHQRPEQTRARFVNGWYRTGDLMRRDSNGFYFFLGRVDDMMVCGGENVYPAEVERLLESHPEVLEAAVVARPDRVRGQVPVAFVVRRPDSSLTAEALIGYAAERGAGYARPRSIIFLDQLPLAGTNKIDRQALTRRAATAPES